jgi:hypothetical protein
VGLSIKEGNNVAGRRPADKQTGLCSDKVAVGKRWHSRETKPKESKCEEGHIAVGVEEHLVLG